MNILLTCVGRRGYLVDFFKSTLPTKSMIAGCDSSELAPALKRCDISLHVPSVLDASYIDNLITICRDHRIDAIFPVSDLDLLTLARNAPRFLELCGTRVVVAPAHIVEICLDKWRSYTLFRSLGIPQPRTFLDLEACLAAISSNDIHFPIIVKPRWGSGSIGVFRADDVDELAFYLKQCNKITKTSPLGIIAPPNTANHMLQELLSGDEFNLDLLKSLSGHMVGFTPKRKLSMRSGETDKAVTVAATPFTTFCNLIAEHFPFIGNIDIDGFLVENRFYPLDINPRFGGGYPFTHLSGANHIRHLFADLYTTPCPAYAYRENAYFAKCDGVVSLS